MAIYHFKQQIISRGGGRSAVAAAAYRHSARMESEADARVVDFSRKAGTVHSEFVVPEDAPGWVRNMAVDKSAAQMSEAFWNRVEAFEKRVDAQLAKELVLALPADLTREQNIALMRDFIESQILPRGLVADWAYHDADGNPHVHLMTSLRPLAADGFGGKKVAIPGDDGQPLRLKSGQIAYRLWAGDKEVLGEMRSAWAAAQNKHLALHGHSARVDHRSHAVRGIDLQPTTHVGVQAKAIERMAKAEGREAKLERLELHEAARRENARRIARRPEIVLDAISREKSVFDRRDVAKYLHRYVDDPSRFADLMARVLSSPEVVTLATESVDPATGERQSAQLAVREMIRLEAGMGRQAEYLADHGRFGVPDTIRSEVLASHSGLSDEQRLAIVVGRAGAGKTTIMRAAREIWEAAGYRVIGGALAGKAAEGLEKEAGLVSRTLASWQLQWERGRLFIDSNTVFVMDEAGMVSSRQMAHFVSVVAHAGAKIVLVGDADQLQPIEAGAAFRSLAERVGYAEIGTIYRQREQWMRAASMDLARGDVAAALAAYQAKGHVVGMKLKDEAVSELIRDWIADYDPGQTRLILGHLRRDVRVLNEMARGALLERGLIAPGHSFQTEDGPRDFAAGEQIMFLRNEVSLGVKNGMIGKVIESGPGRIMAEVGDDHRHVAVDQAFYRNIDHGYATTIHKSQGATIDRVKVLATLSLDRHLTYVAMTRHREDVKLYYGRDSFEKAGGLAVILSKRGAKNTTLDFTGSALYGEALSYATSHGLYGARVMQAFVENQLRWLREQRERVEAAGAKLAQMFARFGRPADRQTETALRAATALKAESWLCGVATWPQSIPDLVEEKMQSDATLTPIWTQLRERLNYIYENPDGALSAMKLGEAMSTDAAARQAAQDRILDQLTRDPEAYGTFCGKTGLFASLSAKQARAIAEGNIPALKGNITRYIRLRAEIGNLRTVEIERERDRSRIDVPALSPSASGVLDRIRDAIDRNDLDAALGFALADKQVKAELDRLNKALSERFGERAFLVGKEPEGAGYDAVAAKVSGGERSALAGAWPNLYAAQRLAAHERAQHMIREQARVQTRDQGLMR